MDECAGVTILCEHVLRRLKALVSAQMNGSITCEDDVPRLWYQQMKHCTTAGVVCAKERK